MNCSAMGAAASPTMSSPPVGTTGGGDVAATTSAPAGTTSTSTPVAAAAQGADALGAAVAALQSAVADLAAAVQQLQARISGGGPVGAAPTATGAAGAPEPSTAQVLGATTQSYAADPAPAHAHADPAPSADVSKWVKGDTKGLNQELLTRLAKVGEKLGKPVTIVSGFRTREEQQHLYDLYKAGKGNLAAKPGTSRHESGNAADVNVNGTSLANVDGAKAIADAAGLHFPVPGEPWHAEVK